MAFKFSMEINGLPKIGNLFKSTKKAMLPVSGGGSALNADNIFFKVIDGQIVISTADNEKVNWYYNCPPLSIIMNRKAMLFNNGKVEMLSTDPSREDFRYKEHGQLWKLYNNPNPLVTGRQFRTQIKTTYELFGFCAVLNIYPDLGGKKDVPSEQWVLPNQYLEIKWRSIYIGATSIHDMIDEVRFGTDGNKTVLPKDDIYFFTDLTTGLDASPFPTPRTESLKYNITNIVLGLETKGYVLKHRGAQGILSNEAVDSMQQPVPMSPEEKSQLQRDYRNSYGLSGDQWNLIITNQSLKYQSIGFNPKDLMIQEFMEADLKTISNGLGYPYLLLGEGSDTTFNNQKEAKASAYQDFAVPESNNFYEQYNESVRAVTQGRKFISTFDHIDVLQENKKESAEVRKLDFISYKGMFKNCVINYDQFCDGMGIKSENKDMIGKYWNQLTPEQRAMFDDTTIVESQGK
jgi:hypothetical protein